MPTSLKKKTTSISVKKKTVVFDEPRTKAKRTVKPKTAQTPVKPKAKKETVSKKKTTTNKTNNNEIPVAIPSVASVRLVEKVEAYRNWYQENFPQYVSNVARVAGFSFILFGTLLTSVFYLADKNYSLLSPAALVCSQNDCSEIPDSELPEGSPLVTYSNSLPQVVSTDTDFILNLENTTEVKVEIISSLSGESLLLNYDEKINDSEFRYLIRPATLSDSTFYVSAKVEADGKSFIFKGPSFLVKSDAESDSEINNEPLPPVSDLSTLSKSLIEEEPVPEIIEPNFEEIKSIEPEEPKIALEERPVTIKLEKVNKAEYLLVTSGNFLPETVEVYAEVAGSKQPLFLGLATLVNGEWLFSLSALDLPVADLKLYAAFMTEEGMNQTESVGYKSIWTADTAAAEAVNLEVAILQQKVELALENTDITLQDRLNYATSFSSSTNNLSRLLYEKQFLTESEISLLNLEVKKQMSVTDSLLQRYASVHRTNYLANGNEAAVNNLNKSIANQVVLEADNENLFSTLITILATRFELYKNFVNKVEGEIEEATAGLSIRDTDKDGLSDLDEAVLYSSSIESVDTDQDGVIDSIEVINGSDPSLADLTSFVKSDSTLKTKIESDVVTIDSIEPLVMKSYGQDQEQVYASVRGRSLPSTYVAVILKSPYTAGLIKTDAAGNFSYFIEKPLVDGNYEVYAALPSNDGELMVGTKPYAFRKTSKEFTASLASAGKAYFETPVDKSGLFSRTGAAALMIVILGFTLLLLAQSLRIRTKVLAK